MIGVLLYSAFMRTGFNRPPLWSVEMAQFLLVAYYILGGAWTLQLDSHVRMDLLYARWTPRKRAFADTITSVCLITYLVVMLLGRHLLDAATRSSTASAPRRAWRPPLAPIKIVMTFGILLMLLQAVAFFFRDLARVRGRPSSNEPRAIVAVTMFACDAGAAPDRPAGLRRHRLRRRGRRRCCSGAPAARSCRSTRPSP